jgi:hypothetical protein
LCACTAAVDFFVALDAKAPGQSPERILILCASYFLVNFLRHLVHLVDHFFCFDLFFGPLFVTGHFCPCPFAPQLPPPTTTDDRVLFAHAPPEPASKALVALEQSHFPDSFHQSINPPLEPRSRLHPLVTHQASSPIDRRNARDRKRVWTLTARPSIPSVESANQQVLHYTRPALATVDSFSRPPLNLSDQHRRPNSNRAKSAQLVYSSVIGSCPESSQPPVVAIQKESRRSFLAGRQPISSFDGADEGYNYREGIMSSSAPSSRKSITGFISAKWPRWFFVVVLVQALICLAFEA